MKPKIIDNNSEIMLKLSNGEVVRVAVVEEMCELFGIKRRTVYYHVESGNVRTVQRRGKLYVDIDSFNEYRKSKKESITTI